MKIEHFEISIETKRGIGADELERILRDALQIEGRHPGEIVVGREPMHHQEEREELEDAEPEDERTEQEKHDDGLAHSVDKG